ncbi:efflux RND transporter permease subunit [Echinicola vietnamensis]|uniref:Cation/multidrug efflux pump n=1 Tax=Echinicola vietnamensis (strain DSM 17526 / LMG 23754 / KMM 6221) TaxID=926556 RepID=L0G5N7_ECHVK|nr:efflux RND transporter permease subunit [Echinicola vietnamensis]AGA80608.1 cation/multidrug efflux pump [Echinicola vietnamensis DSM 17526]
MAEKQQDKNVTREFGLSSLAVNNKTSVIILSLIITFMGLYAYRTMPKESFPEIVIPTVYVGTSYPGNSPVDMENLITRPIEKELKSLKDVKTIESTSIQDYSTIIIEFNPGVDISRALQDTKDAVDKSKSELPTDLDQDPNIFELDFSEMPIMFVNLSGNYSQEELKEFGEYLEDEIEALPEISSADLTGTIEREIQVNADLFKMEAMEVSFGDIADAISSENVTISGGNILSGDFRRALRITGEFEDPEELNEIIVKSEGGNIIYLKDVAEVKDTYKERESYARASKLPVVTVNVIKRGGENLLAASDKIKEILDEAEANHFPSDLKVSITNDQSKVTRSMVANLENSIISGIILVIIVLMFFMGFRNALFVGIAIPLSMFISFMILNAFGVTLNMMVLFSMILALGMLVDNGIVVVENVYRLMQEGKTPIRAAKEGVGEVAWPIITSTATTVAAFIPLAFWQDIMGEFMKYLPITLIIVLSSSLFVGLVINPVVTAMFMKIQDLDKVKPKKRSFIIAGTLLTIAAICYIAQVFTMANIALIAAIITLINAVFMKRAIRWFQQVFLVWLEEKYEGLLSFALRGKKPYLFFFGMFGVLVFSLVLLMVRSPKVEFFPSSDPNYVNIFIEYPIGTDIEATNEFSKKVEDEVMELIEPHRDIVEAFIAQVGEGTSDPSEGPSMGVTPHKAMLTVSFVEYQYRNGKNTTKIMEELREAMAKYPGVQITVDKEQNGPPVGKPINIEVSGEDYEKLVAEVEDIREFIKGANIGGIEELKMDLQTGKPELIVNIDREKARRFGLSTSTIANELRTAIFGLEVSKYKEGEDDYPIQLRLAEKYRYNVDALVNKKIYFMDKFGNKRHIPITSVANFEYSSTYGSVKRKDLDKVITIYSNVNEGFNPTEINNRIRSRLEDYELPDGMDIKFTGEQEEQAKSMEFLMRAMMIAVAAIFLIIVAQFNSLMTPFIIMCSVILSTIGVFIGLATFNMDFVVIMTGIGIISLAGVVVNNAIVLIDYTNLVRQRKRSDRGLGEDEHLTYDDLVASIVEGGKTRLRPVLLTAITTILGLIPMAIGMNIDFFSLLSDFDPQFYVGGDNADFWGPMAWTVIFGLTFATFLTLVIVPVMYLLADKINIAIRRK